MAKMHDFHSVGEQQVEGIYRSGDFPAEHLQKVKEFKFREDDVLIATYPKAGTTWMQELVYMIVTNGQVSDVDLCQRSPFLELTIPGKYNGLETAKTMEGRRVLKTHLYFSYFEESFKKCQPKTIVVSRNLRDNLVSCYHFCRAMPKYSFTGSFEQFVELFRKKRLPHGDWFDFNLGWWKNKSDTNCMFVTYEEMKKDITSVIGIICRFLNVKLSEETLAKILLHTSFSTMKNNNALKDTVKLQGMREDISPFMRKGQVGDSVNYFTEELNAEFSKLLTEKLKGTGLDLYIT